MAHRNGNTQLQRRDAPPVDVKALVLSHESELASLLPAASKVTVSRLADLALLAAERDSKLSQCTPESIITSLKHSAELGLSISGASKEAYLVPYRGKDGYECQLIPGYNGLAKLAYLTELVVSIETDVVHQNDDFRFRKGLNPELHFIPNLTGPRGDVLGYYCIVRLKTGGVLMEWMSQAQVDVIKARVTKKLKDWQLAKSPWNTDGSEMGRKTVFRRVAKWLPNPDERFLRAIELANHEFEIDDVGGDGVAEPAPEPRSRLERLAMGQQNAAPEKEPEEVAHAEVVQGAPADLLAEIHTYGEVLYGKEWQTTRSRALARKVSANYTQVIDSLPTDLAHEALSVLMEKMTRRAEQIAEKIRAEYQDGDAALWEERISQHLLGSAAEAALRELEALKGPTDLGIPDDDEDEDDGDVPADDDDDDLPPFDPPGKDRPSVLDEFRTGGAPNAGELSGRLYGPAVEAQLSAADQLQQAAKAAGLSREGLAQLMAEYDLRSVHDVPEHFLPSMLKTLSKPELVAATNADGIRAAMKLNIASIKKPRELARTASAWRSRIGEVMEAHPEKAAELVAEVDKLERERAASIGAGLAPKQASLL